MRRMRTKLLNAPPCRRCGRRLKRPSYGPYCVNCRRTMRCPDCGELDARQKKPGTCAACRRKHKQDAAIKRHAGQERPDDETLEDNIRRYAARAAEGLPLFSGPR